LLVELVQLAITAEAVVQVDIGHLSALLVVGQVLRRL
jgi:hypothetical protein